MKAAPSPAELDAAGGAGAQPLASAASRLRPFIRLALLAGVGLFYLSAVVDDADPSVALVGFAPLVWLAAEAIWRLFDR